MQLLDGAVLGIGAGDLLRNAGLLVPVFAGPSDLAGAISCAGNIAVALVVVGGALGQAGLHIGGVLILSGVVLVKLDEKPSDLHPGEPHPQPDSHAEPAAV